LELGIIDIAKVGFLQLINVFLKLGRNKTAAEFTVKAPFINRKNRFIEIHLRYLLN